MVAAALLLALAVPACGGAGETAPTSTSAAPTSTASSTTVPELLPSTTTTMFDPATVEGQVEAAYLKSWDVYAHAVYHLELDEQAFAEVYAGDGLANVVDEVKRRIDDGRPAFVNIEHDYDVIVTSPNRASVLDRYVNHQVLIDPVTKRPVEPDPDEQVLYNFVLGHVGGSWRVELVQRVTA